MSTLYNRVLGCIDIGVLGKPKVRSQRILWPLRGIHGGHPTQAQAEGQPRHSVPPGVTLSEALRRSQSAETPQRGRDTPGTPTAWQRGAQRPTQPHSGTGTGTGAQATHSPRDRHRGADRHRGGTRDGGARTAPHRATQGRREGQNAPTAQNAQNIMGKPQSTKNARKWRKGVAKWVFPWYTALDSWGYPLPRRGESPPDGEP